MIGGAFELWNATLESFDGVAIHYTLWKPEGASASSPVPLVLLLHGATGARADFDYLAAPLALAGYGVVAWDARGHGVSGGETTLSHPEIEIRDLSLLLDSLHDEHPWIAREADSGIPKDLVLGGSGHSMGGGVLQVAAAHDPRIDAIVPQVTMHSYRDILYPHEVVKALWIEVFLLLADGSRATGGPARMDLPLELQVWAAEALATGAWPAEALPYFDHLSPATYLDRVRAPALYVQGFPDTAWPSNSAYASVAALRANGVDARLLTHQRGHNLNLGSLTGAEALRGVPLLQSAALVDPCTPVVDAALAFFDEHLRGGRPSGLPAESLALDDGTCTTGPPRHVPLPIRDAGVLLPGAHAIEIPLGTGPLRLAGIPVANLTVSLTGPAQVVVLSLVAGDRVLSSQATALRIPASGEIGIELNGVGAVVAEGETLSLRIERVNAWFNSMAAQMPGLLTVTAGEISVPEVGERA